LIVKSASIARMAGFGGPGGGGGLGGNKVAPVKVQICELKDVQILDTKGKQIDKINLAAVLKSEIVAMASWDQGLDPLHLRVLKDGTLTFVLPAVQGGGSGVRPGGGGAGGGVPGGPGGGGAGGGGAPRP
jgi:hypothetical protein